MRDAICVVMAAAPASCSGDSADTLGKQEGVGRTVLTWQQPPLQGWLWWGLSAGVLSSSSLRLTLWPCFLPPRQVSHLASSLD